jgi:hypothetical protein
MFIHACNWDAGVLVQAPLAVRVSVNQTLNIKKHLTYGDRRLNPACIRGS